LHSQRGTELAHIFKIGTKYSELFDVTYLDVEGEAQRIFMGCYGIGLPRVMAAVVEQSRDERGIIWPFSIAPYQVALLGLDLDRSEIKEAAEQLYVDLQAAGIEVLFDDRPETAGVKFNDADLLGLPLRAVISRRSLKNGGLELKARSEKESHIVSLAEAVQAIQASIS
jgi:prolyl-tRNA synthetase